MCVLSLASQASNAPAQSRAGQGAGLSPQEPTRGREHGPPSLQLLEYSTLSAPASTRPHTFQGPSTGRAPGSKSPEQREQRQKRRQGGTSDRSSPAVALQALGPAPLGKPRIDCTCAHIHTNTRTRTCTHMLTHARSPVHPVCSGEHFHTETRLPSP